MGFLNFIFNYYLYIEIQKCKFTLVPMAFLNLPIRSIRVFLFINLAFLQGETYSLKIFYVYDHVVSN